MRRALLILCVASSARAAEVWKSSDEVFRLEGSGFFKPYVSWLVLQPSLVEGTNALAQAQGLPTPVLPQNA